MMRGIRFLLSLLLVLGMPAAALASHFIPMECVFVKIPDTSSKVVQKDFSEGERKMHFLGGRSSNGSPVLLTVGRAISWNRQFSLAQCAERFRQPKQAHYLQHYPVQGYGHRTVLLRDYAWSIRNQLAFQYHAHRLRQGKARRSTNSSTAGISMLPGGGPRCL